MKACRLLSSVALDVTDNIATSITNDDDVTESISETDFMAGLRMFQDEACTIPSVAEGDLVRGWMNIAGQKLTNGGGWYLEEINGVLTPACPILTANAWYYSEQVNTHNLSVSVISSQRVSSQHVVPISVHNRPSTRRLECWNDAGARPLAYNGSVIASNIDTALGLVNMTLVSLATDAVSSRWYRGQTQLFSQAAVAAVDADLCFGSIGTALPTQLASAIARIAIGPASIGESERVRMQALVPIVPNELIALVTDSHQSTCATGVSTYLPWKSIATKLAESVAVLGMSNPGGAVDLVCSNNVAAVITDEATRYDLSKIVICVTNDLQSDPTSYVARIATFVAACPAAQVIVITPPDRASPAADYVAYNVKAAAHRAALALTPYTLIDGQSLFPPLSPDGVHLTAVRANVVAATIQAV